MYWVYDLRKSVRLPYLILYAPIPKLDLKTLESWLWDSANILRGSIDSSDFKNYIFSILFLKRANDVFDEEVENLMTREGYTRDEAEAECYFKMPLAARWSEVKKATENIGVVPDKAFAVIEQENRNLNLEGVMTATRLAIRRNRTTERWSDCCATLISIPCAMPTCTRQNCSMMPTSTSSSSLPTMRVRKGASSIPRMGW